MGARERRADGAHLDAESCCDCAVIRVSVVAQKDRQPLPLRKRANERSNLGEDRRKRLPRSVWLRKLVLVEPTRSPSGVHNDTPHPSL